MSETLGSPERDLAITTDQSGSSHHTPGSVIELFHTGGGDAYVDISVDGHRETYPVSSKAFRHRLTLMAFEHTDKMPNSTDLKRQIELAQAKAVQPESPEHEVYVRAAFVDGHIYVDVADDGWNAIEIGPDGWRIIHNPPVRFIRAAGMRPVPVPQSGGSIETLRALVNVHDDNDFVLLVAWLLNALCNKGQHPLLVLSGAESTAKSTLVGILRALIDPNSTALSGLPRTERELATKASQGYLQAFDNVSALSRQMSDALCRCSTGGRAHPIILNGIDDLVTRPDLADRCLFVTCDAIPDDRRRSEIQLWAEFENAHAQIFGLLLDALSHGLRVLPETQLDRKPRMADFALWATACEGAFWPKGTFLTAFNEHRAEAVENLIGTDPVASAVRQLAAKRRVWKGTASELDAYLRALTGNLDTTPQGWPADPARLGTRLRELAPSLNKVGVEVNFTKDGHSRTRLITVSARTGWPDEPISKVAPAPTQPNSPSAPSATGNWESKATAEDDPVPATATDATQHDAASDMVDDGEQSSKADGADGTRRSDKRFDLASHVAVGERSVPVYRVRKRGRARPGASTGTS